MKHQEAESNWAPLSDIMTGLMVVFMFIAIAYILEVQKEHAEQDQLFEEFKITKNDLYQELDSVFREDFKKWQVELDKDLSIKFTNPDILFESGQSRIRSKFQNILDNFIPKYLSIVMHPKYKDKIGEIRIEGHTDPSPTRRRSKVFEEENDAYMGNVELSQDRARNVLKYIRTIDAYEKLADENRTQLQFWLTANGLSYGRTLDNDKNLTYETGKPVNNLNSRRVEFRIVTTTDELVEKVIKQLQ